MRYLRRPYEHRRGAGAVATMALVAAVLVPVALAAPAAAAPGDITTFAGGGIGDGGLGSAARLATPEGVTVDHSGNVYIADTAHNRVRRVSPAGTITTFAGTGAQAFSGDGGPAKAAGLTSPADVAVDGAGNLYIADQGNARIRRVDHASGVITTVAGNGVFDDTGDGGPALSAAMIPQSITVDSAGHNLYFSDQNASRVRRVDLTNSTVHAFAGKPFTFPPIFPFFGGDHGPAVDALIDQPGKLAVDQAGNVFIPDLGNNRLRKVDTAGIITTVAGDGTFGEGGDGGPATSAQLAGPAGVAVRPDGTLFIADAFGYTIRKVTPSGIISTVAGTGTSGYGGDGGPARAAQFDQPFDVAVDDAGNLFVADTGNNRVRRVDHTTGIVTTLAGGGVGDGDPARAAVLEAPWGVTVDAAHDVFVSENRADFNPSPVLGNRVRKVDAAGVITTVAGTGVVGFGGDGGPAKAAQLNGPRGVAVDGAGNLFIADCGNGRVREVVASSGIITTVAGGGTPSDGVGDGGQATSAAMSCPSGVFVVTSGSKPAPGTLFIADAGANRVRRVAPDGVITTVAGTGIAGFTRDGIPAAAAALNSPTDVVLDRSGGLLIADENNNRVRRVGAGGTISTVAGDGVAAFGADGVKARSSHVAAPTGLAVDRAGDVFVAESGFARVRRVSQDGVITTVAGNGVPGFSGDGGPATSAQLDRPTDVALDGAGNLFITDRNNNRVRRVRLGGAPPPPASGCGQVLTSSKKLDHDIGPCAGDGIVVGADHVTLDLNGHHLVGDASRTGTDSGVLVSGHRDVTVTGGTVSGFDAGVSIVGGAANTVSHMTVRDNVGGIDPSTSEYGDGIVVFFSAGNRIVANRVTGNGVFDGIGVLGVGSDANLVKGNRVEANGIGAGGVGSGVGVIVNPFLSVDLPRNVSLAGNKVVGNTIRDNGAGGISNISNLNGVIADNVIVGNGAAGFVFPGNGIGVQHLLNAEPVTNVLVRHNQVHGNGANGIDVVSEGNQIIDNDASDNAVGLVGGHDLFDENVTTLPGPPPTSVASCDSNVWTGNVWGSGGFYPDCTAAGGHAAPGTARAPVAAPGMAPPRVPPADPAPRHHPPRP